MVWRKDLVGRNTKRKVLVVEDNLINREMLCEQLGDEFEVIQAENGFEGLDRLEEHYQDLSIILLDVYMPKCNGFEFLRRKATDERYDSVPVIVATASSSPEDEIACLKAGANDFIVKPYNFEIMINRIHNMIRLRESASLVNQLTWDSVTGLLSKEFFFRAVEDTLAARPDVEFDMLCSDIDDFKTLNDRYGEALCDEILRDLATRLEKLLPGLVASGRIGGDSFAFLMEHQPRGWEEALTSITSDLHSSALSVKFGIVECVDHGMTPSTICNRAESTLNTLKGSLGVAVAHFDEELHESHRIARIIRDTMEEALEGGQFMVHYQPKHDVRCGKTGGAEALVRWTHPELGYIRPDLFIELFERSGFIDKLDLFVWETACKQIKRCEELGLPAIPISVNTSRLDFDEPDLAERLANLADSYGVDHALLHVELTETAYSESPDVVIKTLRKLKERGFFIELDDFGAGYSSLVSLNMLPLDVMKLDMSMVRQATALDDFRIVESMIRLAQSLGLDTVVEGVETDEQARQVIDLGCDYIQGYYYSRPLGQEDFEDYLANE